MLFSVKERIILLNVVPNEGKITDLRLVQDLKHELAFNEAENTALESVVTTDERGGVDVPPAADEKVLPKHVDIGPRTCIIIKDAFEALDRKGKMQMAFLPLYDRLQEAKVSENN